MKIVYIPKKKEGKIHKTYETELNKRTLLCYSFLPFFINTEVTLYIYAMFILGTLAAVAEVHTAQAERFEKAQEKELKAYRRKKELQQMHMEQGDLFCDNSNTKKLL